MDAKTIPKYVVLTAGYIRKGIEKNLAAYS